MALERSMNANVLRRWVVAAEREEGNPAAPARALAPLAAPAKQSFVPVSMGSKAEGTVRIEVRRGNLTVNVQWPASGMHECSIWLHEVLK